MEGNKLSRGMAANRLVHKSSSSKTNKSKKQKPKKERFRKKQAMDTMETGIRNQGKQTQIIHKGVIFLTYSKK